MNPPPRFHLRIRFRKTGKIRFTSHRDVARLFERAIRKCRLPVAYSEGFSPRPKLSFGLALSVAHESEAEYLDVELTELIDLENLADALTEALPDGLTVEAVGHREKGAASLQQAITSCTWRIEIVGASAEEAEAAVAAALAAEDLELERVRKGKNVVANVRPAILELRVLEPTDDDTTGAIALHAELATVATSLRPSELVTVLAITGGGLELTEARVRRLHQWMIVDEVRSEPLGPPDLSRRDLDTCPKRQRAVQLPTESPRSLVSP